MMLQVWWSHEDCSMLEASLGFRVGALSMSSKGNNPQAAEKEVARRQGPISQSVVPKLITCQRMGLQRSPAARPRTSR